MSKSKSNFDVQLKFLLIGDSGVGKTCLLQRYVDDTYQNTFVSTVGIDFKIKMLNIEDKRVRCQLWDTAGQERFRTITRSYYRGAHGMGLCFDMTDKRSFDSITNWTQQIKEHADEGVTLILIATKCDATEKYEVTVDQAKDLAAKHGLKIFFTSAKTANGVDEPFDHLAREGMKKVLSHDTPREDRTRSAPSVPLSEAAKTEGGKGCGCT